jgi:hypothetical protein
MYISSEFSAGMSFVDFSLFVCTSSVGNEKDFANVLGGQTGLSIHRQCLFFWFVDPPIWYQSWSLGILTSPLNLQSNDNNINNSRKSSRQQQQQHPPPMPLCHYMATSPQSNIVPTLLLCVKFCYRQVK